MSDNIYNESLGPNECWFCGQNCVSWAKSCNCGAVTLPTRSIQGSEIIEWNVLSPMLELQCPILRMQMMICFATNNGAAVRLGAGRNKVLIMQDHKGVRVISWSLEPAEGERVNWAATRLWDDMGEEEWAQVRRVLEEVEVSRELVEGMRNI